MSILSIENVQHEHIGNYSCIAENEAGRSSHSAVLNVNGIPRPILKYASLFFLHDFIILFIVFSYTLTYTPLEVFS